LNQAGTGYTLVASGGALTGATSATFNVTTASSTVIESFENGLGNYYYTGSSRPRATTSTSAAHDGAHGLLDNGDGDWYLRLDSAAKINPGDTVSVWTRFVSSADGRAYFGFGTTTSGTLAAVLAPNTGQLIIQNVSGFSTYTNLASVSQSYQANHWYRVEVAWGTSGTVIVRLYDSNGTTLLNSVTVQTNDTTAGEFAFRAIGSAKDWDTVTVTHGVNSFALAPTAPTTPQMPPAGPATTPATPAGSSGPAAAQTGNWWAMLTGLPAPSAPTGAALSGSAAAPEMFLPPSLFADMLTTEEWLGGLPRSNRG
jgi:hypothetical protein